MNGKGNMETCQVLKIGVMLRHLGQPGGIGVYTASILNHLLKIDRKNHYFFLYQDPKHLGKYADFPNVSEAVVPGKNKIWWDQVSVPRFAKRAGLDLIYNPKLSVPLFTRSKTVLVMHGSEQFAVPHAFKWYDRIYFSIANRLYCRSASAIIVVTHQGAKDIVKYMGADPKKVHTIYDSYNESCRVLDPSETAAVREKYALPERYILFVGGINPLKNFGNILRTYSLIRSRLPHKLVAVGFRRWKYTKDLELINQLGLQEDVIFTNFIPDEDIPAIYNLAEAFVFPSLYEGFGMPVLEAMACGCPVVATKTGCTPEVAGGAALLVDPYNPDEIARATEKVLTDAGLRCSLREKGLARARQFSWEKCARETLEMMECLA